MVSALEGKTMLSFYESLKRNVGPRYENRPTARDYLIMKVAELGIKAFAHEKPVAWGYFFMPQEMFAFFDAIDFMPEVWSTMLAAGTKDTKDLIDSADSYLGANDPCTFQRVVLGGLHSHYFPDPDFFIRTTYNCDASTKWFQICADHYRKPLLFIDVPNMNLDKESTLEYVAAQLERTCSDISRITGAKLTQDKIEEVFSLSNQARANMLRSHELRRRAPSPYSGWLGLSLPFLFYHFYGTKEGVEASSMLVRELEATIASGTYPVNPERHRIYWIGPYHTFPNPFFKWLEKEKGVSLVFDEYSHIWWEELDAGDPYRSLARHILGWHHLGAGERRCQLALEGARKFNAQGVIHFSNWGCRMGSGAVKVFKKLCSEQGVPYLDVDVDPCDERDFNYSSLKERVEGFLATI